MNRNENGFTLIEILVVVAILATLMGLVALIIPLAERKKLEFLSETRITSLRTAIDLYNLEFDRLPPMTVAGLAKTSNRWKGVAIDGNVTNEGIEACYVALQHPDFSAKIGDELVGEGVRGNTDEDTWNRDPLDGDGGAYEVLDGYDNPIIYIDKNNYGKSFVYVMDDEREVTVTAVKKADGTFYNPRTYQLISLGANGELEEPGDPTRDDITNFTVAGE